MNTNEHPPKLTVRITWLGLLNYLGALLTAGWTLYLVYRGAGAMYAVLSLLVSGFILRFGASPLLVLASSVLYFRFGAAGIWLPLVSYAAAGLAFRNDLQLYRERQATNP